MLTLQEQATITTIENALNSLIHQGCSQNSDCYSCTRSIHKDNGDFFCGANKMYELLNQIRQNIEEE